MRVTIVATFLLFLAGCAISESATSLSHEGSGGPYEGSGSVSCADSATLDGSLSMLSGNLTVRVLDGAGAIAFEDTLEARDGGELMRSLFGTAGTWKLEAHSANFEGKFTVSLSC